MKEISEQMLDELRDSVMQSMSPKRFRHTLAVEDMILRLCALFCPEYTVQMRAAALLHDVTKCKTFEEQISLAKELHIRLTDDDLASPRILLFV